MFKKIFLLLWLILQVSNVLACKVEVLEEGVLWGEYKEETHRDFVAYKIDYIPLRITLNKMTLENGIIIKYNSDCYILSKDKKSLSFKDDFLKQLTKNKKLQLSNLAMVLNPFYFTYNETKYSRTYYAIDKE